MIDAAKVEALCDVLRGKLPELVSAAFAAFKADKFAVSTLAAGLGDGEWRRLKRDEDCRRSVKGSIPEESLSQVKALSDSELSRLLWFVSEHNWQKASRELLPAFKAARKQASSTRGAP